ncbi:MAG TPA: CoA transferase, partial [Dehalococcoidia bacterium]|nr:CoA transferase [Dehalococcoidia bacterium]
ADVFVESYPPGTLPGWGLGYADLVRLKPDLIYASITDFGQTGPYRDYQGGEIVAEALGGLLYTMGLPEREPLKISGDAALMTGGISAFSAILVAIHQRDETALGQYIDVALMESVAVSQIHSSLSAQFGGHDPGRRPSTMSRAKDGWITAAIQQGAWRRFCDVIGRPDLADDPRLADWASRRDNPEVLDEAMAGWLATQAKEDVYHLLQSMRSVAGYVADVGDLFRSKQYQAREFFRPVDHPATGPIDYPGPAFRIDDDAWRQERAPLLGEQNDAVLHGELGLPKAELARLRAQGAI